MFKSKELIDSILANFENIEITCIIEENIIENMKE